MSPGGRCYIPPVGGYVLWVLGLPGKPWLKWSWRLLLPGARKHLVWLRGRGVGLGASHPPTRPRHPWGKGVNRFFCDVHRRARNGEGYRITFSVDGITFKNVDRFAEIPATSGDKVCVDTLPLNHTDDAIELLRRGVEIYCLRRLTLIKERREELKLPKTVKGDIKALMSIDERWFRKLSEDFLIMRRMISAYRSLQRTHQQLENKCKALSEAEKYTLKTAIKALENQMNEMAKKIAEEAGRRYPTYKRLVEELDIDGNTTAMEALAELMPYLEYPMGYIKLCNLLGLFKPIRGKKKIYSGHLRKALQRLTASTNNIPPYQLTAKMEKQTLHKIWKTYRQETQGRLAIPAQG
jgi:hypothetical protein